MVLGRFWVNCWTWNESAVRFNRQFWEQPCPTMKVLAGRDQDIEDLQGMRIRQDEVQFVRDYLDAIKSKGTKRKQIEEASVLLDSLNAHDHG